LQDNSRGYIFYLHCIRLAGGYLFILYSSGYSLFSNKCYKIVQTRRHEVELRKLMNNSMTFFILFSQKRCCVNNSTDRINNDNYSSLYATLEYAAGFKSEHIEKTLDIVIVRSKYEVESL
jgi:hypothetical protein